jgi:hypothetical protein
MIERDDPRALPARQSAVVFAVELLIPGAQKYQDSSRLCDRVFLHEQGTPKYRESSTNRNGDRADLVLLAFVNQVKRPPAVPRAISWAPSIT